MRKMFLLSIAAVGLLLSQPVQAQTVAQLAAKLDTANQKIAAANASIAELQAIIGLAGFNSPQIPCTDLERYRPTKTFTNGEYDLQYRNRQFGCFADPVVNRLANLDVIVNRQGADLVAIKTQLGSGTTPIQPPSSTVVVSGQTIPGLTAAQISDVVQFLTDAVNAGYPIADIRDLVRSQLNSGVYSYANRAIIDAVKLWYYSGSAGANRAAAYSYLSIIDQRDPDNPNVTLTVGDPRWKLVGGTASIPTGSTSGSIVIASDETGGGHYAALSAGAVDLKANTMRNSTQSGITNPYCGQIQMNGWDGGLRLSQNYQWQCTPELPWIVWGGDSHGAWSYQQAPEKAIFNTLPASATFGQSLIFDGGWSQRGYDYATGAELPRSPLIAAQRGGESLLFAVTPSRTVGQFPTNKVVFRANADGSPDPFEVVINGQLRRLKACNIGGQNVVCF